jgi:hypothetical protein
LCPGEIVHRRKAGPSASLGMTIYVLAATELDERRAMTKNEGVSCAGPGWHGEMIDQLAVGEDGDAGGEALGEGALVGDHDDGHA